MLSIILFFTPIFYAACARKRFIKEGWFFNLLKYKGASALGGLILTIIPMLTVLYFNYDLIFNYDLFSSLIYVSVMTLFLSLIISEAAVKGPFNNTRLTFLFYRVIVHIDKGFVPPKLDREKYIKVVRAFIEHLASLPPSFPGTVVFKSHLISPLTCSIISKELNGSGLVNYEYRKRKTPLYEVIGLNLLYGGKTRFRILSLDRHPNGFRVNEFGSSFKIIRNKKDE
ncbi:hypothetical protein QNA27_08860 [Pantoea eucalypti]|uniref:hypothetical protein n=1 Tax=Pantoea eucalypti TaxID=470933 RepID=UPI0024B8D1EC|nr:hypothetical protein [Pantoea eucalypti]MDJ0473760.1 hypothetical protein [Pantoea eucalypti]